MHGFVTGIFTDDRGCRGYVALDLNDERNQKRAMKYSPSGQAVLTVHLVTGDKEKKTQTYIDVELWGSVAEKINELYQVGKAMVALGGRVVERRWEYPVGSKKWWHELKLVWVDKLEFEIDGKLVDIPISKTDRLVVIEDAEALPEEKIESGKGVKTGGNHRVPGSVK